MLLGLLVFSLSGCHNPDKHPSLSTPVDWNTVVDDPENMLEITWMGPLGFDRGQPGSWIQRQIESRFNLLITPVFMDQISYSRTRSLRFVAGDIPDVFWNGDPLVARRMSRHGFVLNLPYDVILEQAPDYARHVLTEAPEAWMYSHWQDGNWGLPTVIPNARHPLVSLWRKDWLRNVGIDKVPETMDEMHEALRRFTFNDPDGNGRHDTYGISPPSHHWSLFFSEFFAAEDILPFDLQEVDGEITWGGIRPQAKTVLAMLRNWYQEGLIDPDFVLSNQSSQSQQAFFDGRTGYLGNVSLSQYLNKNNPTSLPGRMAALHPESELIAAPPLKGSDGKRRARTWGAGGHILQFSKSLENNPEKVIRILRWLNEAVLNPDWALELIIGKRGLHWDYTEAEGLHNLPPYLGRESDYELTGVNRIGGIGFFMVSGLPLSTMETFRNEEERQLWQSLANPEWGIHNVLGKTDVLESAGESLADLRLLQMRYYTEIIRGNMPLSHFDVFVETWLNRGGREILEEARAFIRDRDAVYESLQHHFPEIPLTSHSPSATNEP